MAGAIMAFIIEFFIMRNARVNSTVLLWNGNWAA